VEGRCTTLKFDGYVSEQIGLPRGIDQGCPQSGILFQFYNVGLVDMCEPGKGEEKSTPFLTAIGSIMYVAMGMCIDVAFAVQHLSQFSSIQVKLTGLPHNEW